MPERLTSEKHQRLASLALKAASCSRTDRERADYLALVADNARQAELALSEQIEASDEGALARKLLPLLLAADRCGFSMAALHINTAIIALGGAGTPPGQFEHA